ncbi:hypothetical protein XVE_4405, partial [Xanthomonas vesicatoria ATCC 35937]
LAVLADIGAVKREIAAVTRPHPVVDGAAELAHAGRRCIGQAYVLDLQVLEQPIGVAAGKAEKLAAIAGLRFALGDLLLAEVLQRLGALERVIAKAAMAALAAVVTSAMDSSTLMRVVGPALSSSSGVAALNPSLIRFFCSVELSWIAP